MAKHNAIQKTNAMRMLDKARTAYEAREYPHKPGEPVDGETVAALLGQDPARVFKTLVTQGAGGGYFVFVVPVAATLDLKKAARAVGEKSVAMIPVARIEPVTGYVRGGCSPVGMKKAFPTVLDATAADGDTIMVSGGRIGLQIQLAPADLLAACGGKLADLCAK